MKTNDRNRFFIMDNKIFQLDNICYVIQNTENSCFVFTTGPSIEVKLSLKEIMDIIYYQETKYQESKVPKMEF